MNFTARLLLMPAAALVLAILAGCADVNVHHNSSDYNDSSYAAPAATDNRSAAQIAQENRELRARLATLEDHNRRWQQSVDARKREINQLKDQRDALKKQRDRLKKAVEGD